MNIKIITLHGRIFATLLDEFNSGARLIFHPCSTTYSRPVWLHRKERMIYEDLCKLRGLRVRFFYTSQRFRKIERFVCRYPYIQREQVFICGCDRMVRILNQRGDYFYGRCMGIRLQKSLGVEV